MVQIEIRSFKVVILITLKDLTMFLRYYCVV